MGPELLALIWSEIVLGATAGLVTGAVGMGAGAILAPGLLYLGWEPGQAVTVSLITGWFIRILATMLIGGHRSTDFWVDPEVEQWLIRLAVIGGVGGAVTGTVISHHVSVTHLRTAIGVMLLVTAAAEAVRMLTGRRDLHRFTLRTPVPVALGFLGGTAAALTSVGAGTVIGTGLRLTYRGLSTAVIARAGIVAAMFVLTAVIILRMPDLAAFGWAIPLLLGGAVGAVLGGLARDVLPERALRIALAVTIALSGLRIVIT
jgi:uncharacterized membrane protein YfcA